MASSTREPRAAEGGEFYFGDLGSPQPALTVARHHVIRSMRAIPRRPGALEGIARYGSIYQSGPAGLPRAKRERGVIVTIGPSCARTSSTRVGS
jgi:hypothetical protein